jgi:transaldolase
MKIFVDTANLTDIEEALKRGFVSGVTTNPSILAKEPKSGLEAHVGKMVDLIRKYDSSGKLPLSIEVFSRDPDEMISQALRFKEEFDYPGLCVKVHVGWNELAIISELARKGIDVNCTAIMTVTQAIMAAQAGARYVSLFWGRIGDAGKDENFATERERMIAEKIIDESEFDSAEAVRRTRSLLDKSGLSTEIIVGSIRSVTNIRDAYLNGAHIVTIPPKFFSPMVSHYKTDEVVEMFLKDFQDWLT